MPHKIRSLALTAAALFCFSNQINSQSSACLQVDTNDSVTEAFKTFEKDLFQHYSYNNDTIKTYRTFLMEVASLSIDLRKLPSQEAIQKARDFKKKANEKKSIWVKLSDYENQEAAKKPSPYVSPKKDKEDIYTFNYRGGFMQCLKNTNDSEDFKDIITLLENDGNISTSLISQRIYYMTDKEINTSEVKEFIAFDIYYSILMVIEKAF